MLYGGLKHSNYNKQEIWVYERGRESCQVNPILFHGVSGQRSDLLRKQQESVADSGRSPEV